MSRLRLSLPVLVLIALGAAQPPATSQQSPLWALLQWMRDNWNQGILSTLIGAVVIGSIGFFANHNKTKWRERSAARAPDKIHLWSLIGEKSRKPSQAVALLDAINRGALEQADDHSNAAKRSKRSGGRWYSVFRRVKPDPEKAARIWEPSAAELRTAQHEFVAPDCVINDGGRQSKSKDAVGVITKWLEQCDGTNTEKEAGRISVRAPAGAGKTIFMHRLFLEASARKSAQKSDSTNPHEPPVPMFASAMSLQRHSKQIETLQTTGDPLRAFILVWLSNREIEIPQKTIEGLVRDFEHGLTEGRIALLLDGDDELRHQGLTNFAEALLPAVRYWVVAHRPGPEFVWTARKITLHDTWDYMRIEAAIDKRWATPRPAPRGRHAVTPETVKAVKEVIADVLRRHNNAARKLATSTISDGDLSSSLVRAEPHWLSQPRNLDLYLGEVEKDDGQPRTKADLERWAENQPALFDRIVGDALTKLQATESLEEIRHALFNVAITDPTNTRRQSTAPPQAIDARVAPKLRDLDEIVGFSEKRRQFYFRHAALRAYFIAGQTARELLEFHKLQPSDELNRSEIWSATKRTAVASWLNELTTSPTQILAERLRRDLAPELRLNPGMRRNVLDLLIKLTLDADHDRRHVESVVNLDLAEIPGYQLDLRLMRPVGCDFRKAVLTDAELTHATFTECDFRGANLSGADAMAAVFDNCDFGQDSTSKEDVPTVTGMAIDRAEFTQDVTDAPAVRAFLEKHGASLERSRYRGEFGRKFFDAQHAFLGSGVDELEKQHYVRAIEECVISWTQRIPGDPIYLVDLMAGGSYKRVTLLREKFDQLHVLGIDRDPTDQPVDARFRWASPIEIGKHAAADKGDLGFDITALLRKEFGDPNAKAHVIAAKKALHEIDRELQALLIEECARALHPGGRLILFEDTPGPAMDEKMDGRPLDEMIRDVNTLRLAGARDSEGVLVDADCEPSSVARALERYTFDATAAGRIGFTNAWIMVKDWANLNRHEVTHRYFASVSEICDWARGPFGEPREVNFNHYRLNPLIFNELGIQRVLDHLEREVPPGGDRAGVVERDEAQLAEWIWDSERLKVLVDFTRRQLASGTPLAAALDAKEEAMPLDPIDPALALLNRPNNTAPSFNLPCAVLVFEKDQSRIA